MTVTYWIPAVAPGTVQRVLCAEWQRYHHDGALTVASTVVETGPERRPVRVCTTLEGLSDGPDDGRAHYIYETRVIGGDFDRNYYLAHDAEAAKDRHVGVVIMIRRSLELPAAMRREAK